MSDELKSAVELAMEKMDAADEPVARLSDEQKARIADIRSRCQARIAQEEIHRQADIARLVEAGDPAALQQAVDKLQAEKQRLEAKMEREVAKVHEEAAEG